MDKKSKEKQQTRTSLKRLRLKLNLHYFGHFIWRANSLEKTLILEKVEGRRRRGQQRMRWLDRVTELVKDREAWSVAVHSVTKSWTWLGNTKIPPWASLVAWEVKNLPANAGDLGLIPGLGRSRGEGNGSPLQYSCLENPMDKGAWQATIHGVSGSWTWLSTHISFKINCFFVRTDFRGGECILGSS